MTPVTPEVDLFSLVFLLGAAQGLFLVLALLTVKKGARQANRFLALFTLTFSITLIDMFLEYTRYYAQAPWLIGVIWTTNYLYGPLLLLYTTALIKKEWTPTRLKTLLHFLPFALSWVIMLPFFLLSADVKIELFFGDAKSLFEASSDPVKRQILWSVRLVQFLIIGMILQIGIYLIIILTNLHKHGRRLKDEFSYTDKISLNWLRYIAIATLGLWIIFSFSQLLAGYFQMEIQTDYALHVMIAVLIYTMGYLGLRQPEIFKEEPARDPGNSQSSTVTESDSASQKEKYQKSSLDREQAAQLAVLLTEKMQKNSLYLDSQLTLPQLAGAIETTPHYLSQAINGHLGKNFFDFVNEYRIEEAKRRIGAVEKGRMNVLAIALDSGFSSKSAFYTAFKRHTGMTPSEYKQQIVAEHVT
jgi:AraC-like DNA-binding protein